MTDLSNPIVIPGHVPEELYRDLDLEKYSSELDDPYDGLARLYDGPDIFWARGAAGGRQGWVLTRHDLIQEVLMTPQTFSSRECFDTVDALGVDWRLNPLEIDPPFHSAFRQILQPKFQPSAMRKLEGTARDACIDLIGAFDSRGSCEFVEEFGLLFPSRVFLALFGLPLDRQDQFLEWAHSSQRAPVLANRIAALHDIKDLLEDMVEDRRANPHDDLLSYVANAELGGERLAHGDVLGMCMTLYLGGLDTVTSSLGWYFRDLARDQSLQRNLRDNPSRIPDAVSELLRKFPVVATARTVAEDVEFHGVQMKKGDVVAIETQFTGRDPRHYEAPNAVDLNRKARHLTLGTGIHNCLGVHLAKLNIKVVLEEWLSRIPAFSIADEASVSWHTGPVWGLDHLPLTWAPRTDMRSQTAV